MYLTDIRGFTAEDYYIAPLNECSFLLADGDMPMFAAKAAPMCKITIHGMGIRGSKGLSLHFANFCRDFAVEPRFTSVSDMGIAFFVEPQQKETVLDALCEYFPMWV